MNYRIIILEGTFMAFDEESWQEFLKDIEETIYSDGICHLRVGSSIITIINIKEVMEKVETHPISRETYETLEKIFADSYGSICFPNQIETQ